MSLNSSTLVLSGMVSGCGVNMCREFLASLSKYPRIQELLSGVDGEAPKIECRPCTDTGPEGNARAALFNDSPATIVLCTNRLERADLREALTHELVHAYDFSNKRCNFYSCDGLAYTEVRAAREAECNRPFPVTWLRDYCIKDMATRSTKNIYGKDSHKCVERVFDSARADEEPVKGVEGGGDSASVA